MNRFAAILRRRCPHCCQGNVFRSLWHMNEDCPVCGVHFEREQGYWMMSVFMGYVIYGVILAPAALILYFQNVPGVVMLAILAGITLLLALPVFLYARVIWLHIDERLDPRKDDGWVTPRDYLDVSVGNRDSNK